jgi:hypothetical protein
MAISMQDAGSTAVLGGQGADKTSRAQAPVRDGIKMDLEFPARLQDWSPANISATLEKLFNFAVANAERQIDWYNQKGQRTGQLSRLLRIAAILCGTIGTLVPLIDAAGFGGQSPHGLSSIGYVLLAVAAALVAADSAFGVSSSWMRFRAAQVDLELFLGRFRYDWNVELAHLNGEVPDTAQRDRLLTLQKHFVEDVEAVARNETNSWIQEFRGALTQMAQSYRPPLEPRPQGSVQVTNVHGSVGALAQSADAPASVDVRGPGGQPERKGPALSVVPDTDQGQGKGQGAEPS